jgi:Protein of unknown function (DUF3800)
VTILHAYFDESYGDDDGALCVAGYVFKKAGLRVFDARWNAMLQAYKLPYFRMSACAHRNDVFAEWDRERTIEAEKTAIEIIKTCCSYGVAVSFRCDQFRSIVPTNHLFSTPYEMLVWHCLTAINAWVKEKMRGRSVEVAYFFEAGHRHQNKAGKLMSRELTNPNFIDFHSSSYAFVKKENSRHIQAPDILAWHVFQEGLRRAKGQETRKDFASLLQAPHYILYLGEDMLKGLADAVRADSENVISFS